MMFKSCSPPPLFQRLTASVFVCVVSIHSLSVFCTIGCPDVYISYYLALGVFTVPAYLPVCMLFTSTPNAIYDSEGRNKEGQALCETP